MEYYVLSDRHGQFWDIKDENSLSIRWDNDYYKDYLSMSSYYYEVGDVILKNVIEEERDLLKMDQCFFVGIYLLRHSIELKIKALLFRVYEAQKVKSIIQNQKHNVLDLFKEYLKKNEFYITKEETQWLNDYLTELTKIDENGTIFRYNVKQWNTFDNCEAIEMAITANQALQACGILNKIIFFGKKYKTTEFDFESKDYIIASNDTVNNTLIHHDSNQDFFFKMEGYISVFDFIYKRQIESCIKFFPMMFIFRNAVELSIKMFNNKNTMKTNSKHKLQTSWKQEKKILEEFAQKDSNNDIRMVEKAEGFIVDIDTIDSKSDAFRYPTDNNLQYYFNEKKFDIKNIYENGMALLNFLHGCNLLLIED